MGSLKIFGLGFFSDKIADKAQKGGFSLLVVNFILVLVIILFGSVWMEIAAFYPRYERAENLKKTVENLFDTQSDERVTIFVDKYKYATASRADGEDKKEKIVDTYSSAEDRAVYSAGGFNVVVDMRPSSLYDDFEAYCEPTDKSGENITYEDYLSLNEVAKQNYKFCIRYTPYEVDVSEQKTIEREQYIQSKGDEIKTQLDELKSRLSAEDIDQEEYNNGVWVLYVKAYYPDMSEYEQTSPAPLLRNYYYHNHAQSGQTDYLFIFDDSIICSFTYADGKVEEFYGFYENFETGKITKDQDFIKTAFSASYGLYYYVDFVNVMRFLPIYVVMPIVAALIAYLIEKIALGDRAKKFSAVLKVVSAFMLWAAVFGGLMTMGASLFIDRNLIFVSISALYFAVTTVRTIIWFAADIKKVKKETEDSGGENIK